jgi:hypothetical protein
VGGIIATPLSFEPAGRRPRRPRRKKSRRGGAGDRHEEQTAGKQEEADMLK